MARRRHRNHAAAGVTLLLLFATALWRYGGFPISSYQRLWMGKDQLYPTKTDGQHKGAPKPSNHNPLHIPPKVWQIMLPKKQPDGHFSVKTNSLLYTLSWLALNPDYTYTLVGPTGGAQFVHRHFANEPKILAAYNAIPNVGMKSDLLRYLLLSIEGGVYTDIDTFALRPIETWVSPSLRDRVRMIVGIEYDQRDGIRWGEMLHSVQFGQWTIAAAPDHPVFRKMVDRILRSLSELSETYGLPLSQLRPSSGEVMNVTGPAAWTEVVFQQLQEHEPTLNETKDLSYMTEPTLFGDILVLTIDGFGMGQPHSNSTNDGTIPEAALVRHLFGGSWRGGRG
ncbi:nucleotide-diphospho-sugar transferase [Corynascus novoguineensis]|uniref:Nucleotide-diphospho-sugar transferase n=1 Tax=Corynascus novoguineensis TaxID=1126955 RepID=A0AAN7CJB9_9PEZI|nr:nucleotide-diphospho-sugar transferase [Corynascus novoguineensis]